MCVCVCMYVCIFKIKTCVPNFRSIELKPTENKIQRPIDLNLTHQQCKCNLKQ